MPAELVAQIRQQRAQQMAQQQMAALQQGAQTAQTLAQTPMEGQTALGHLMENGGAQVE